MAYFGSPAPRIFGHRGAAGLAPENTLPSFALARALGASYLELDVHGTKDGVVVVLHDPTLDRTTDGTGPVREQTWDSVAELDAGYRYTPDGRCFPYRGQGARIPTLESVLRELRGCCFNIEIKQENPPIVQQVFDVLRRARAIGRTLLAAEHHSIMERIRSTGRGSVVTSMSAFEVAEFIDRLAKNNWQDYTMPARAAQIPCTYAGIELVTRESVDALHRFGCEVHVWTINDPDEIERLLDLGVDGIMSDLPGLVAQAVRRRRIRPPS
jgi:glycerophosphoryl diester phosphodiesterase